MSLNTGFVIWNNSTSGITLNYEISGSKITFDSYYALNITGTFACYSGVTFNSTDANETYSGTSTTGTGSVAVGDGFMIVGTNDLTITASGAKAFGSNIIQMGANSSIVIHNGGLLALGSADIGLNNNGLSGGTTYAQNDSGTKATSTDPGSGSLTLGSNSKLEIFNNARLHIGSYQNGKGILTIEAGKTLTLGDGTNEVALNIGAVNNTSVENTVTVTADSTITDSIINVGGGCGGKGGSRGGGGGAGGNGTLEFSTSSPDVSPNISGSRIFIGSGGGGSGGGSSGGSGGAGGNGGTGTLTVSSSIENSIVFVGGAGGGGTAAGYGEGGGAGGNGGSGTLTISNPVSN